MRRELDPERIQLDDTSWVDVTRGWMAGADDLCAHLVQAVNWRVGRIYRYDHHVEERRLGAGWHRDRGQVLPHAALAEATRALQTAYGVTFSGFGMIQYRDGDDGQGFHRDTDLRWLDDTIVAVLTLGTQRPWLLRPRGPRRHEAPAGGATHDLAPASGDLLVMGGRAQSDWEHSVAYQPGRRLEPRVSIQWRHTRRTGRPHVGASYNAPRRFGDRPNRAR